MGARGNSGVILSQLFRGFAKAIPTVETLTAPELAQAFTHGVETAYKAVDGTVSKGVEFELNGAITDNWQLTFGATRYIAEDNEGNAVNPNLPRTTVKMFTSYRLPVMPELTVGGGVNWQNRVYTDTVTPYGTFRAEQGSYALVDLFTRYQVTKNFSLQGNVNNLFDKTYDTNVEGSIVYGAPRNFSITGTYQF